MRLRPKKILFICGAVIFGILACVAAAVCFWAGSPANVRNITDSTVIEKGAEYTVRISGVHENDAEGFRIAADNFYYSDQKVIVYEGEDGFARTSYEGSGSSYMNGKYSSSYIRYADYEFCGEKYKNQKELEAFFELPDPIYNFDVNNLSGYISEIISYKKSFNGSAKVKIYRGRCVIESVFIGGEKVLEFKK